jgi:ankyrin repeat protein
VLGSDITVIDLLLRYQADPNAQNNFQETPFHFACKRGNPMIINLLLQNKAEVNAVDKAGKGAIHHAAHGGSV